jgi:adenine-specific DNA-methyltransferase
VSFKVVASIPIAGFHQHERELKKAEVKVGQNPTALRSSRAIQLPLLVPQRAPQLAELEAKGVVYMKRWVVELLLDLAGYESEANQVDAVAVEPAAGDGAFLGPMIERLAESCQKLKRPLSDCKSALIAYELDEASALRAMRANG